MADKVITAVFGKDLRIQLKKRELSASGTKIKIVPAGEGYFMPEIGPTTFLDWPSRKRYIFFGPRTYKRVFFAQKLASKCVDFGKEDVIVHLPDPEQLKRANAALLAEKIYYKPAWLAAGSVICSLSEFCWMLLVPLFF